MRQPSSSLPGILCLWFLAASGTRADVLAFTDFDASTIGGSTNIKTNLGWVLNGLEDPGDMAALNAAGNPQLIFDGNAFVQDIFIPGLNTGNGNTFWTTDVSLSVAAGASVTLTDVTFNSVSVNGSQAENVNRRNDYTVSLLSPSLVVIDEVTVADTLAGTGAGQPLVSFDLADTVLAEPGTYTLRIKGGDFVPPDETGNHTGLDNLSINGTVAGASDLAITGISLSGGNVVLTTNAPAATLTPQISQDLTSGSFTDVDGGLFSVTGTNEITINAAALSPPADFFRVRE